MSWFKSPVESVFKCFGHVVAGSNKNMKAIKVATLSTAEELLKLINSAVAQDIGQLKGDCLRNYKAETDIIEAEAKKEIIAKAAEAANIKNKYKYENDLAQAEIEQKKAETRKTEAMAQSELMRAEGQLAKDKAEARLLETMSRINQEGGGVFYSAKNLQTIIKQITDAGIIKHKIEEVKIDNDDIINL